VICGTAGIDLSNGRSVNFTIQDRRGGMSNEDVKR
jgi:hypothetical protein